MQKKKKRSAAQKRKHTPKGARNLPAKNSETLSEKCRRLVQNGIEIARNADRRRALRQKVCAFFGKIGKAIAQEWKTGARLEAFLVKIRDGLVAFKAKCKAAEPKIESACLKIKQFFARCGEKISAFGQWLRKKWNKGEALEKCLLAIRDFAVRCKNVLAAAGRKTAQKCKDSRLLDRFGQAVTNACLWVSRKWDGGNGLKKVGRAVAAGCAKAAQAVQNAWGAACRKIRDARSKNAPENSQSAEKTGILAKLKLHTEYAVNRVKILFAKDDDTPAEREMDELETRVGQKAPEAQPMARFSEAIQAEDAQPTEEPVKKRRLVMDKNKPTEAEPEAISAETPATDAAEPTEETAQSGIGKLKFELLYRWKRLQMHFPKREDEPSDEEMAEFAAWFGRNEFLPPEQKTPSQVRPTPMAVPEAEKHPEPVRVAAEMPEPAVAEVKSEPKTAERLVPMPSEAPTAVPEAEKHPEPVQTAAEMPEPAVAEVKSEPKTAEKKSKNQAFQVSETVLTEQMPQEERAEMPLADAQKAISDENSVETDTELSEKDAPKTVVSAEEMPMAASEKSGGIRNALSKAFESTKAFVTVRLWPSVKKGLAACAHALSEARVYFLVFLIRVARVFVIGWRHAVNGLATAVLPWLIVFFWRIGKGIVYGAKFCVAFVAVLFEMLFKRGGKQ